MARLSLPKLLREICKAVAADEFTSGGWKKHSVRGQGCEGKEKAKGDKRKETGSPAAPDRHPRSVLIKWLLLVCGWINPLPQPR